MTAKKQTPVLTPETDEREFISNMSFAEDPVSDLEGLSDEEIRARYRSEASGNIMPKSPEIPDYHTCWVPLTSNNMHDSIPSREGLGYRVVKPEEVPAFSSQSNRAGQVPGCVSHNEMILMKIPERIYQLYMKDAHYTQPIEQEVAVKERARAGLVDGSGQSVERDTHEMTGINKLARKVAEPTF